jgi:gas vesicle protein
MHEEHVVMVKQASSFGTFIKGALIGAAVALLFAPRSGRETREFLSERGGEIYDKASYIARDTRDRAQTIVSEARTKIEDVTKHARHDTGETNKELKRELEIMEDVNNPHFPL